MEYDNGILCKNYSQKFDRKKNPVLDMTYQKKFVMYFFIESVRNILYYSL